MAEEERKDIANIISSIITSNKRRMTIQQLNEEFYQTVGYKIPYGKFECNSSEQFLRTLKNKILINGSGLQAEVQTFVTNKTAHINDLITKQRVAKPRPRRYTGSQRRRNYSYYTNDKNYKPQAINHDRFNNTKIMPTITSKSSSDNIPSRTSQVFNGAIPKEVKEPSPIEEIYFSDEETRQNMKVPQFIQENLMILINEHPNGIMCSNMLEFYRKKFGQTLKYTDYGYRSIAEMCADLKNIFNVLQLDQSDIKLFSKNTSIPKDTLNIVKKFQLMKIKASRATTTEDAIPDPGEVQDIMYQIHSERTPRDIVQFGTTLEKQWIDPGTMEQDYLDVNVGEIYDPSKFWINLKYYAKQLNDLMDNLQIFYAVNSDQLRIPPFALRKDLYIVCKFAGEYHRGKIVDISQSAEDMIKVYFFDYGTVAVISKITVCYLHNQFAELPEQAIRARLASILPPIENEQWSRASASRFLDLVLQKDLVAQIIRIDEERKILDIILADTSIEDEDFFINDALVSMGYAVFSDQKRKPAEPAKIVPIVRYIHLFPTHVELEHGLVPTATQSIHMHQAGMRIEQMYPHYFKDTDTDLPISVLQAGSNKTESFEVDYDSENAYYEAYEEEEEVDTALNTTQNISAIDFLEVSAISSPGIFHWEDAIEEVELNSIQATSLQDPITDTSLLEEGQTCVSDINETRETSKHSPECQEEKFTQTHSSTSTLTDTCDAFCQNPEPQTSTNEAVYDQRPNFTYPKQRPNITRPARPPPGYEHVIPQKTSVTYNYNSFHNSPGMYPYQKQPYGYNAYITQYNSYRENLVRYGAPLSQEHLYYLQNFNYFNTHYYNNYQYVGQPVHPCSPPPGYGTYQQHNYGNQEIVGYNTSIPESVSTQQVVPSIYDRANMEVRRIENVPLPIGPGNPEPFQDEIENLPVSYQTTNPPKELLSNILESNKTKSDSLGEVIRVEGQIEQFSDLTAAARLELEVPTEMTSNEETYSTVDSVGKDLSEVESTYEDCDPHDDRSSDLTLTPDSPYKAKLITSMNIGERTMHVINHETEFYFLLAELSEKVFGKTYTPFYIRKVIAAAPYVISVVDIRLKTNPELKNELLVCNLITKNELTVDAIPIKYLKDLTMMISAAENHVDNINDLLKGVDYFLSKLKRLETTYF